MNSLIIKIMRIKIKLLIILFLTFFEIPLNANASLVVRATQNRIELEGECSATDVTVTLNKKENTQEVIYSGGTVCENGKFLYSDDLLKWNIEDGEYEVKVSGVNSGKTVVRKEQILTVQREPEKTKSPDNLMENSINETMRDEKSTLTNEEKSVESLPLVEDEFSQAVNSFGQGVDQLNQSLDKMGESYPNSRHSENSFIKTLIELLGDALKALVSLFNQLVGDLKLSSENAIDNVNTIDPSVIKYDNKQENRGELTENTIDKSQNMPTALNP
jgi:hypothetical protein